MGRYFIENNFGKQIQLFHCFVFRDQFLFCRIHLLFVFVFVTRTSGSLHLERYILRCYFLIAQQKGQRCGRNGASGGGINKQRGQNGDREIIVRRPGARGESCNRGTRRRAQKANNITRRRRYADVRGGGGGRGESEGDETKAERVEREEGEETADSACRWLIIVVIWRGSLSDDETSSSPSPPLLSVSLTRL